MLASPVWPFSNIASILTYFSLIIWQGLRVHPDTFNFKIFNDDPIMCIELFNNVK